MEAKPAAEKQPRVKLLDDSEAAQVSDTYHIPKSVADLNLFRALLRRPQIARALSLLGAVLFQGDIKQDSDGTIGPSLDPRLRELAILRIAWRTRSVYEWTQHWRIATRIGIPADVLASVRDWRTSERLESKERAVLAAVDEIVDTGSVNDSTWVELASFLDDAQLVELTVVIGNWIMASVILRTLRIPLEQSLESWPPDGLEP